MHRTQIQLEDWQYELLSAEAESEGRSLASLVREAVTDYLDKSRSGRGDRLSEIAGIGDDREAPAGDHDRFLYGDAEDERRRADDRKSRSDG